MLDNRFFYEPAISGHPTADKDISTQMLGKIFKTPIWVSSMTGGTEKAKTINKNLARACGEYGMGMGLGSCRVLLDSDDRLADFDMRSLMGDQALYANLGVAQVEELLHSNKLHLVSELINKLQADGLIIHINPLQEWLQPEGDIYHTSPVELIKKVLDKYPDLKIIAKEVGQGMGPKSLRALYDLPLAAVDFASGGGTNFALLELFRGDEAKMDSNKNIAHLGHSAEDMVDFVNTFYHQDEMCCHDTIISGGVKDFLDGYFLTNKIITTAVYGQASAFLKYAMDDYEKLQAHVEAQIKGLQLANQLLTIRKSK